MSGYYKTIYNNKTSPDDVLLADSLLSQLPTGISSNDRYPLTILSDEEKEPVPTLGREEGKYDYERLLGYYVAEERKILLLRKAIVRVAGELEVSETGLRAVVFAHELGHYYTHLLPLWDTSSFSTDLFNSSSLGVLEGWAQLFAFWAVRYSPTHNDIFIKLLKGQSYPYHVFEQYEKNWNGKWSTLQLLHSLDNLRKLTHPTTIQDWNNCF